MKNSQRPGSLNESKLSNHNLRHKEKRRTESLNKAFCELRKCIPHVPCDTKLSKIKTLQLASSYIAYLSSLLEDPRTEETNREFNISFNPCLSSKRRKNNSNFIAAIKPFTIESGKLNVPGHTVLSTNELSSKKAKGRTGWPETVWAEALENGSPPQGNCQKVNGTGSPHFSTNDPVVTTDYMNSNNYQSESTPLYGSILMFGGTSDCMCSYNAYEICCTKERNGDINEFGAESSSFSDIINSSELACAASSPNQFSSLCLTSDVLPSISTLCSSARNRNEHKCGPLITEFEPMPSNSRFNSVGENKCIDEPQYVELQTVSKF